MKGGVYRMLTVKVTVTDDNGKPYQPKNMPYNPIEREER